MRSLKILPIFFLINSCSSRMSSHAANYGPSAIEEIRIALVDVKHSYDKQQMDLEILEEKCLKLEKGRGGGQLHELLLSLEKKIINLEKSLEKTRGELHQLSSHATQTTNSLLQYRDKIEGLEKSLKHQELRIDEVVKLKHTLNSISKAMGAPATTVKIHKVHSGESLEKIARKYNTSIDAIKELNALNGDTIFVDQELKIPN